MIKYWLINLLFAGLLMQQTTVLAQEDSKLSKARIRAEKNKSALEQKINDRRDKKNANPSWFRRTYHNVTAHYNGYYNAQTKLSQLEKEFKNKPQDDYAKILHVFPVDATAHQGSSGVYDLAIKKCSKVIQNHAISSWADESYSIIGKSYFYRKEFFESIETFQFISGKFVNETTQPEALIWAAKAYVATKQYEEAKNTLTIGEQNPKFPSKYKSDLNAAYAQMHIEQREYDDAIKRLNNALRFTKDKTTRTRYNFILGQLYQIEKKPKQAINAYNLVAKEHPEYEMYFNTQINIAKLFDKGFSSASTIKGQLSKMIKDAKNKDYLDQIYYELGSIAIKENETDKAQNYFLQSLKASKTNYNQKASTYLALATLYFDKQKYVPARNYYDSATVILPQDFPDYNKIMARKDYLNELVYNLIAIQTQDSLLALNKLSDTELYALIDKTLNNRKIAQEKKQREEQEKQKMQDTNAGNPNAFAGQFRGEDNFNNPLIRVGQADFNQQNAWYFYNEQAKRQGYNEFVRKWGQRTLEDNWRRSQKQSNSFANNSTNNPNDTSTTNKQQTEREEWFANVPKSKSDIEKANTTIINAYFGAASIYQTKMENNPKAIETYDQLVRRYEKNKYLPEIYYSLYLIYQKINNNEKANYYKNLLVNGFPNSNFAQLITNPSAATNGLSKNSVAKKLYEETYADFINKNYTSVMTKSENAIKAGASTDYLPKFAYLKAVSIGKTSEKDKFITALQQFISQYPQSPLKENAEILLQNLMGSQPPANKQTANTPEKTPQNPNEPFVMQPDEEHYCVFAIPQNDVNYLDLQVRVNTFNAENFESLNIKTSSMIMGMDYELILVKSFANKQKAMSYFIETMPQNFVLKEMGNAYQFVITKDNFATLYRLKMVQQYQSYFDKNYFKP